MTGLSLAAAFLLGLASTLHCWGMCGGIIGALSMGLTRDAAAAPLRRALLVAGFNAGRVLSYAVAGLVAGSAGGLVLAASGRAPAYLALQLAAAAMLVAIGLHLAGWFPALGVLEAAGSAIWRRLQAAGRLFLPVDSLPQALVLGSLWGWLPCGLVYSTLLWTAAHADPLLGAGAMAAFGLGTLPGMIAAGLAAGSAQSLRAGPGLRRAVGALIIVLGLASATLALLATGAHDPDMPHHAHG
jgi:hypothetical protein